MSVNRIALGKRISFYRLKFSMTQEKLADLTNCSREYIAYLENGVKTPSLPILVDLANALHISVDTLHLRQMCDTVISIMMISQRDCLCL